MKKKFDFSGYATRNDLLCSDGRIIRRDAFAHNDGQKVPIVWQHAHNDPSNVLGHGYLENREDGVYVYGTFNDTETGRHGKELVRHGDVTALSIFANKLKQRGNDVIHGQIREVSLVMSGANPGAFIDNVSFGHSDGSEGGLSDVEAIIYTGEELELSHKEEDMADDKKKEAKTPEESKDDKTVKEVFDTLTDEQKNVVYALIGQVVEEQAAEHSDLEHSDNLGGDEMRHNIFEGRSEEEDVHYLSHDDIKSIMDTAAEVGSMKESVLMHAEEYGIENIDFLFPDPKTIDNHPDFIKREDTWVKPFFNALHKTPFSRIKTIHADITEDEARAKGYITGNKKIEEVFKLLQRSTTPQTVYKKQKLDRDDIIDIVDLDVVAFMKKEMRMMLDEELARAVIVGDGRNFSDDDKINEDHIRPVYSDDELYSHRITIEKDRKTADFIEDIIRARKHWKGNGRPNLYTTTDVLTDMLLVKDQMGRRLYATEEELRSALRVNTIEEVEVMENVSREDDDGVTLTLKAILFNPSDYAVGADKGGQVSLFDDFDIDYNQYKYLIETRMSGALRYPKSALVFEETDAETAQP